MQYLALDLGQVLYDIDIDTFIKILKTKIVWFATRNQNFNAADFIYDLHGQQDIGVTTIARALKDTFGFSECHLDFLVEAWKDIPKPNKEMMEWVSDLEDNHDVKIALLSNIGKTHSELIGDKFPETYKNKILHLSCEVGARKPSKLYYQSFLWDHPEFKGCTYLDDRPENIEMGNYYGFNSIQFDLADFNQKSEWERKKQLNNFKTIIGVF